MNLRRFALLWAVGFALAAVMLAACSAIDPEPPHPHVMPTSDPLTQDPPDAGEAGS
jgi:hypothetical protein